MKNILIPLVVTLAACVFTFPVFAEEAEEKGDESTFKVEIITDMLSEQVISSDDTDEEHNNTVLETEVGVEARLGEHFSVEGIAVLEPVKDFDAGEDNFFEDEGVLIEELLLKYENGPWEAYTGKINPGFNVSLADKNRGIWSEDFSDEYEINEKIGVGGSYTYESENLGAHTLGASTFFADTTFLSGSLGNSRARTTLSDGGVSNTEDFSSYLVLLEGELPEGKYAFGKNTPYYKLGYRHLAEGDADSGTGDETGHIVTIGDNFVFDATDWLECDVVLEFTDIKDFENTGNDHRYYTAGIVNTFHEKWNLAATYTERNISGSENANDHLLQVTVGYDFGEGVILDAGWRNTEEDGVNTDIIGARLRYSFEYER